VNRHDSTKQQRVTAMAVKLDWDTVQELRRQHAACLSYRKIAAKYGTSNQRAISIVKRRRWKVEPAASRPTVESIQPTARQGV
jgi:hypothetical protein